MIESVLVHFLQYASYALELILVVLLFTRGRWKNARSIAFYFLGYVILDTIFRPVVLYIYGYHSFQYRYSYWISDVVLTLGAFLLICLLFRRACSGKPETWSYLRSMLAAVFVIIAFVSYFSLADHYGHLFTRFIIDLQQNLYFSCLVLNTLLFIMLQQWDSADERLSLFVCGLGIEFAGPAANLALMYLTPGGKDAGVLLTLITPLCNVGMCMIWLYAMAQKPVEALSVQAQERDLQRAPAMALVHARESTR